MVNMVIGNYTKIDWSTFETSQSEEQNRASNNNKLDIAVQDINSICENRRNYEKNKRNIAK